jgi:glycosyltransferase involved in cell wall biosynthesis
MNKITKCNQSAESELKKVKDELKNLETTYFLTKSELANIYGSRSWKIVAIIQKLVRFVLPRDSIRRRLVRFVAHFCIGVLKKIKTETASFIYRTAKLVSPPKLRSINVNSRKVVYIGHSYHAKTKSTAFLIDYLKKHYDVTVILDESWQGKEFPDLSFIDSSYLAVIFFQNLPPISKYKTIKNENLIFFPMYDGQPKSDYGFLAKYKNIKAINFSQHAHKKCLKYGIDSIHIKYFPPSPEFNPGNKSEVFFWQRVTGININTAADVFKSEKVKIHLHKAVDPAQQFIEPTKKQEKKFSITYSEWFDSRNEMWDFAMKKGIYFAPREYEGIGLSFLEAMAMGKAVVAVDNPTMNEYIVHNETGYLFDLRDPKPLNLKSIEQIQKNAYEYMKVGCEHWEKDKANMLEFIHKQ